MLGQKWKHTSPQKACQIVQISALESAQDHVGLPLLQLFFFDTCPCVLLYYLHSFSPTSLQTGQCGVAQGCILSLWLKPAPWWTLNQVLLMVEVKRNSLTR